MSIMVAIISLIVLGLLLLPLYITKPSDSMEFTNFSGTVEHHEGGVTCRAYIWRSLHLSGNDKIFCGVDGKRREVPMTRKIGYSFSSHPKALRYLDVELPYVKDGIYFFEVDGLLIYPNAQSKTLKRHKVRWESKLPKPIVFTGFGYNEGGTLRAYVDDEEGVMSEFAGGSAGGLYGLNKDGWTLVREHTIIQKPVPGRDDQFFVNYKTVIDLHKKRLLFEKNARKDKKSP